VRFFARDCWWTVAALACAPGLARGGSLPACTGANFVLQETQQTNCVVVNPGGQTIVTESFANDPAFVNTPVNQTVNQYRTTLTALLNGGTTVFQQTFAAPFSNPSVQNAVLAADALLTGDAAAFGAPLLTSNSTALQSSVLSYVPTSTTLDLPTLIGCVYILASATCSNVAVTNTTTDTVTFGPATIMIGPDSSDQFVVQAGQVDINVNNDYTYTVDQNAITTNTYLTTQSYGIDGVTNSSVPEPSSFAMLGAALVAGSAVLRRRAKA